MSSPTPINSKIVSFSVVKPDAAAPAVIPAPTAVLPELPIAVQMNEGIARPEMLPGSTYKIKTPALDHALYVTINDIVLNPGTPDELRRPFEIFINSKNMDQFQWVVALTRIMSAVFRKGGDVTFLVAEMKAVFDPHGGYYKPGGVFMPSLIADIGTTLERHLTTIGLIQPPELSPEQKRLIQEKRAAFEANVVKTATPVAADMATVENTFPPTATMCSKCNMKAVIVMDGCQTCLNCGSSKCG